MKKSLEFVNNIIRARDELVRKWKSQERAISEFSPNHAMKIDDSEYYRQADIEHARRLDKIASKEIDEIAKKLK